jgi:hypothetical protein
MKEQFERVLAANSERRTALLEGAICARALDQKVETEAAVPALDQAIELFNGHAEAIDRKMGESGFFGVRLVRVNAFTFRIKADRNIYRASNVLDFMQATEPDEPVWAWMSDLLFMLNLDPKQIDREAKQRGRTWDRKLRKRKWAIVATVAAKKRDTDLDIAQDQIERRNRSKRSDIQKRHRALDHLIREASPDLGLTQGAPHHWRAGNKLELGVYGPTKPDYHARRLKPKPTMARQEGDHEHRKRFLGQTQYYSWMKGKI